MADDKKDILEFPLKDLSIPQAIGLMMQAATARPTIDAVCDEQESTYIMVDNERLAELCEKLEARVEDELDASKGVRDVPTEEDNPNEPVFSDIEGHKVSLEHEFVEFAQENLITKVLVDNVVFVLTCNERVFTDVDLGTTSTCMKRFGHFSPEHEDMEGNVR